jgi:hypothetical protein
MRDPVSWSVAWLCLSAAAAPVFAQASPGSVPDDVRSYTAYRAPPGISVDGRLDEDPWDAAPWTEPFVDIRDESHPAPTWETHAKLLWDDEYLYVAAHLEEPHLWATLIERDAIIYHDNDFEIFLDPEGDAVGYYEFEVNALGTMLDLYLNRPYNDRGVADISWDAEGLRWGVHLEGTLNDPTDEDQSWSVEVAIPWSSLVTPGSQAPRRRPNDGEIWRVNFSRVQWPLRIVEGRYQKVREPVDWSDHPENNWVWSPQGAINMHMPERWGAVTFRAFSPPGIRE